MTPHEAAKLLDLPVDAAPEQIETRFNELRAKLEDKVVKAPTPGLKAKYRESLEAITTAFETLTLAADSSSLPVLQRQRTEDGRQKTGPKPAGSSDSGLRSQVSGLPAPKPKASSKEFLIVAVIALVVLGTGGWWVMKTRAENAEKARLAAEAKAEADRVAAEQARQAEELKLRQEKTLLELRSQLAELNVSYEATVAQERAIERSLEELRRRPAQPTDSSPQAKAAARALSLQIAAMSGFLDWLRDTVPAHPASLARARAGELVSARAAAPATEAVAAYRESLDLLKKEIRQRTPDLDAIAARAAGEPILAQWREVLRAEEKEDRDVARLLPPGATPLNADRDLAVLLIEKFARNPAGIPADFPAAVAWLEKNAAANDFSAMLLLAEIYLSSKKVPHDEETMWLWRYRAAEAGDAATKHQTAIYSYSQFSPWSLTTRIRWLRQAAQAGHVPAQRELSKYAGRKEFEPTLSGTLEEERQRAAAGSIYAAQQVEMFERQGEVPFPVAEAIDWLRKDAAAGDVAARQELGRRYAMGDGVELDWAQALDYFHGQENDPVIQYYLAEAYANGWGVEEDQARAFAFYLQVAQASGWNTVCLEVAQRYAEGNGVDRDDQQAIAWYSRQELRGNEAAREALRGRGLAPDGRSWAEAVQAWQAKLDDPQSQLGLAEAYEHGHVVTRDPVAAFTLYSEAAEKNLDLAGLALVRCYLEGIGVPRDQAKAVEQLRRIGGPAAKPMRLSFGLAPDGTSWEQWIVRLKEEISFSTWALGELGAAYQHGHGVPVDLDAAVNWYRKGAEEGDTFAMLALGRCYASGTGVAKDEAQAIQWLWRAAARGDAEAKIELRKLRTPRPSL